MQLVLNHREYCQSFAVTSQSVPAILGMDFLLENMCSLDFVELSLEIRGKKHPLRLPTKAHTSLVRTTTCETLPAHSEVVLPMAMTSDLSGVTALVEPCESGELPEGVLLARSFVDSTQTRLMVRMVNVSANTVTLPKDLVVGRVCPAKICEPLLTMQPAADHVQGLLKEIPEDLAEEQASRFKNLLVRYQDVFSKGPTDYGRTSLAKHTIETGSSKPIKLPARRVPLAKHEEVAELIHDMRNRDVIEPSNSPWAAPIVLVRKKDGSARFCVDYRRLNDVTKKDSYPLPRMDDIFSNLAGSKWFSTMDLQSGYWQVEMDPKDKEKTAFSTGSGLWQFNVMPFGLCNAPATFERLMDEVFRGMSWQTALIYLDDIIVYARTFDDHLLNLEAVFLRLRAANLKLSPGKCKFLRRSVRYLGHIVSEDGLVTDPEKVQAVQQWPTPRNKKQVRSFLGLCSYYRRFIEGFSTVAKPLSELTEERRRFVWSDCCETAFRELKRKLTTAPILAFPTPTDEFILDTDASNVGIGAVLSQRQGDVEVVLEYYSKTLNNAEKNYCVTRRELLAVVLATHHFHHYLFGRRFTLRTDHASLRWLCNFKHPEGQMARWLERLQQYSYDIQHRPGPRHGNADALSRRVCDDCKHCTRAEQHEAEATQRAHVTLISGSLEEEQKKDPVLAKVIKWKEEDGRPGKAEIIGECEDLKAYWSLYDQLSLENGTLVRMWEEKPDLLKPLPVVPRACISEILASLHDSPSGGHLGQKKTLSKVKTRYFWIGRTVDVKVWCLTCETCVARRGPSRQTRGGLQPSRPGCPFERIAIDILGPLPRTLDGNRYIVVVMDYFTKWPECFAIPNQTAEAVLGPLVDQVFCRFGVPQIIHSDQGRNFESAVFQAAMNVLGIEKTRTTPLHPQSDGMVERFNRTLLDYLAKYVDRHQTDWDRHLQPALLAYRSAEHESTGFSPSLLNLGREVKLPSDLAFGAPSREELSTPQYALELRQNLHKIRELARRNLHLTADAMKSRYDLKKNAVTFNTDDEAWFYNPKRRKGISPKLQNDWEGPVRIRARLSDLVYRIQVTGSRKTRVVHVDRLAPFRKRSETQQEL